MVNTYSSLITCQALFHVQTHFILTAVLWHGEYYPHFTDKETEAETD